MDSRTAYIFDEDLREVPLDPEGLRDYLQERTQSLASTDDPKRRVALLGELGTYFRMLGDLGSAEKFLVESLQIINNHQLGVILEVQQKLRLAHVLQWKKDFVNSNALFAETILTCRNDSEAKRYLDFALQHAGKNQFDQQNFKKALEYFTEALELRQKRMAPTDQMESTRIAMQKTHEKLSQ